MKLFIFTFFLLLLSGCSKNGVTIHKYKTPTFFKKNLSPIYVKEENKELLKKLSFSLKLKNELIKSLKNVKDNKNNILFKFTNNLNKSKSIMNITLIKKEINIRDVFNKNLQKENKELTFCKLINYEYIINLSIYLKKTNNKFNKRYILKNIEKKCESDYLLYNSKFLKDNIEKYTLNRINNLIIKDLKPTFRKYTINTIKIDDIKDEKYLIYINKLTTTFMNKKEYKKLLNIYLNSKYLNSPKINYNIAILYHILNDIENATIYYNKSDKLTTSEKLHFKILNNLKEII